MEEADRSRRRIARRRHRSLEHTIQILGIGFGDGTIISSVIVQHINMRL
ncbi:hypothetical protein [Nostoc sp. C117]